MVYKNNEFVHINYFLGFYSEIKTPYAKRVEYKLNKDCSNMFLDNKKDRLIIIFETDLIKVFNLNNMDSFNYKSI